MISWLFKDGRGFQLSEDAAKLSNYELCEILELTTNAPSFGGSLDIEDAIFYSQQGNLVAIRVKPEVLVVKSAGITLHSRIMKELGGIRLDENGRPRAVDLVEGGGRYS